MSDATRILQSIDCGDSRDSASAEELLPLVYVELKRLANARMASEPPGQTLQPTALVHEAWLKLRSSGRVRFTNSSHFIAAAAEAMRRIMIDRARRRATHKHGGDHERLELTGVDLAGPTTDDNLLCLDEALSKSAAEDPEAAELVNLRYLVGLTASETAAAMEVSLATVKRRWAYARAWLYQTIKEDASE